MKVLLYAFHSNTKKSSLRLHVLIIYKNLELKRFLYYPISFLMYNDDNILLSQHNKNVSFSSDVLDSYGS